MVEALAFCPGKPAIEVLYGLKVVHRGIFARTELANRSLCLADRAVTTGFLEPRMTPQVKFAVALSILFTAAACGTLDKVHTGYERNILGKKAGASNSAPKDATHFSSDRTYVHNLFASQADCDAARAKSPGPLNCFQEASFSKSGSATLMVTDIMNIGTYTISGGKMVLMLEPSSEVSDMTFALASDGASMTDSDGNVWSLKP